MKIRSALPWIAAMLLLGFVGEAIGQSAQPVVPLQAGSAVGVANPLYIQGTVTSTPWSNTNKIIPWDGTTNVTVKPASTAPVATDPALVVAISPNSGSYFTNVAGSTTIRTTTTATYTANTTVCATGGCVAGTVAIASATAGKGLINRVTLLKSGSVTAAANFTIWFFSAAPTLTTPTQNDNVAYSGPRASDMPNYIGNAQCTTPVATSDTSAGVWYDCTLSNPNSGGALDFQALAGQTYVNYLISVTGTYAQASGETFIPYVSGLY